MLPDLQKQITTFQIQSELRHTKFITLLMAQRTGDASPVLLMVLNPELGFDAYFVRLFKEMGERHMRMEHPHILKLVDAVDENGVLFFVYEFPGGTLFSDWWKINASISSHQAVTMVQQLSTALDYAHSMGNRHGNISTDTIIIHQNNVYLFQFGLAQLLGDVVNVPVADPRFLPPERLRGESPSRSADLYGAGVLAYLLLTGKFPFAGDDVAARRTVPVPPHAENSQVRPAVSEVVLRMLSKGVELRHSTGAEFARALQMATEGTAPVRPITAATMSVKPRPRVSAPVISRRVILLAILGVLLAASALLAGYWAFSRNNTAFQTPAATETPVPVAIVVQPVVQSTTTPTETPTRMPTATATLPSPPTATSLPQATGASGTAFEGDVFSRLVLAEGITDDYKPLNPRDVFSATTQSVYLFFHYAGIKAGTPWQVEWQYNGSTAQSGSDTWSADYGSVGTAWVFYAPLDGFKVGEYSVTLSIEGTPAAGAVFSVQ